MKKSDQRILMKAIAAGVPGIRVVDDIAVCVPLGRVLRCFMVENCSSAGVGTVWGVVQPISVPHTLITLNMSAAVGRRECCWTAADADRVAPEALITASTYFPKSGEPGEFCDWIEGKGLRPTMDLYWFAVSAAAAQRWARAETVLLELVKRIEPAYEWQHQLRDRCALLAELIRRSPDLATKQVLQWEASMVAALGLGELYDPPKPL